MDTLGNPNRVPGSASPKPWVPSLQQSREANMAGEGGGSSSPVPQTAPPTEQWNVVCFCRVRGNLFTVCEGDQGARCGRWRDGGKRREGGGGGGFGWGGKREDSGGVEVMTMA